MSLELQKLQEDLLKKSKFDAFKEFNTRYFSFLNMEEQFTRQLKKELFQEFSKDLKKEKSKIFSKKRKAMGDKIVSYKEFYFANQKDLKNKLEQNIVSKKYNSTKSGAWKLLYIFYGSKQISKDYFSHLLKQNVKDIDEFDYCCAIFRMWCNEIGFIVPFTNSSKPYNENAMATDEENGFQYNACIPHNPNTKVHFIETETIHPLFDSEMRAPSTKTLSQFISNISNIIIDNKTLFMHICKQTQFANDVIQYFNYTDFSLNDLSIKFNDTIKFRMPNAYCPGMPRSYFHKGNNKYDFIYILPNYSVLLSVSDYIRDKNTDAYPDSVIRWWGKNGNNYGAQAGSTKSALTCMPFNMDAKYNSMSKDNVFEYCYNKNYSDFQDIFDNISDTIKIGEGYKMSRRISKNFGFIMIRLLETREKVVNQEVNITAKEIDPLHEIWIGLSPNIYGNGVLYKKLALQFSNWFGVKYKKYMEKNNIPYNLNKRHLKLLQKVFIIYCRRF